jgi:hypothetical protein
VHRNFGIGTLAGPEKIVRSEAGPASSSTLVLVFVAMYHNRRAPVMFDHNRVVMMFDHYRAVVPITIVIAML